MVGASGGREEYHCGSTHEEMALRDLLIHTHTHTSAHAHTHTPQTDMDMEIK